MRKAFTLSEVMLVLSVIGVIAALTIPGLIQSTQNKQLVTQLKKEYSVLSQAFTTVAADNDGDVSGIFTGTTAADSANAMNTFAAKLNVLKNCGSGMGCWYDSERKFLNGNTDNTKLDTSANNKYGKAVLSDGTLVLINVQSSNCSNDGGDGPLDKTVCGLLQLDVNGAKGPNVVGRDNFEFWLTKTGIYPEGSNGDLLSCDTTKGTWGQNTGCTAKVLQEGAMNY